MELHQDSKKLKTDTYCDFSMLVWMHLISDYHAISPIALKRAFHW